MGYEVQTEVFEGPFDLLLHLITAEQVDVYEVSLSRIVDAYLAEVERMQQVDLEIATEFLLIAATLVAMKCRRLLPGRDDVDLDEELALFEERDMLLSRLVECKTYSNAARALAGLESSASRSVPRRAGPDERFDSLRPDLLEGVTPEMVRQAALRAFAEKPRPSIDVDHILVDELTVAEVVGDLAAVLPQVGRVSFRQITEGLSLRIEVIVHFLAVLELYKQGTVELEQGGTFGEITLWWVGDAEDDERAAERARELLVEADYRG
ncbi:MAG TPA: segregation/condensation protein A [Acidimicrobiales bacterium]|nr:segregation/condensation protein A [Acidimicrobiales bacterium]